MLLPNKSQIMLFTNKIVFILYCNDKNIEKNALNMGNSCDYLGKRNNFEICFFSFVIK